MSARTWKWAEAFPTRDRWPTHEQLVSSGFCRIRKPGERMCIRRINRKNWQSYALSGPQARLFTALQTVQQRAHLYRELFGSGLCDVPAEVWGKLPESDDPVRAPSDFRYHWKYPEKQRAQAAALSHKTTHEVVWFDEFSDAYPYEENLMSIVNENAQATESTAVTIDPMPMKTVVVTFPDTVDREFVFFAPMEARVGDYAVIFAKGLHATRGPFSIGKIERETPDVEGRASQAILGTFNEEFAKHVEARMAHLASIKGQLAAMKKQFEEAAFYELMAEKDPRARALLDQLKQFRV